MFRVKILLYEKEDQFSFIESEIPHALKKIGILAEYAEKSQKDFDQDPLKIKKYASEITADAWISISGLGDINTALSQLDVPVFALYGYLQKGVAGIGQSHYSAMKKGIEQLIKHGHDASFYIHERSVARQHQHHRISCSPGHFVATELA